MQQLPKATTPQTYLCSAQVFYRTALHSRSFAAPYSRYFPPICRIRKQFTKRNISRTFDVLSAADTLNASFLPLHCCYCIKCTCYCTCLLGHWKIFFMSTLFCLQCTEAHATALTCPTCVSGHWKIVLCPLSSVYNAQKCNESGASHHSLVVRSPYLLCLYLGRHHTKVMSAQCCCLKV